MAVLYRSFIISRTLIRNIAICDTGTRRFDTSSYFRDARKHIECIPVKIAALRVYYSTVNSIRCWKCKNEFDNKASQLFCNYCNSLQKPNNENFFDIIGIKQAFDIDENMLTNNYKNLQKKLHPDKYGARSAEEKSISEEYSSLVNKAYSTLLKPLSRGMYLLNLQGLEIPEKTEMESSFLIQIMERNEEVEQVETVEEILKLNSENKNTMKDLCERFSTALQAGNTDDAISILTHLKYYDSIDNEIKKTIRRMGIIE